MMLLIEMRKGVFPPLNGGKINLSSTKSWQGRRWQRGIWGLTPRAPALSETEWCRVQECPSITTSLLLVKMATHCRVIQTLIRKLASRVLVTTVHYVWVTSPTRHPLQYFLPGNRDIGLILERCRCPFVHVYGQFSTV